MLVSLTLTLLLAGAQASDVAPRNDTVEPLIIQGDKHGRPMISDRAIEQQLNQLVKDDPSRVVCMRKTVLGSRIPRGYCGTLRQWYDVEATRATSSTIAKISGPGGDSIGGLAGPPPELVQLIRARLQSPKYRAMAEARAKTRLEAEAAAKASSPIDPGTSHP